MTETTVDVQEGGSATGELSSAEAAVADWRSSITDESLRKHADRFASPADVVKNHFELRKKLSTAIVPPNDGASEDDVAAYHANVRKALGVPETPEGYALPESVAALTDDGKAALGRVVAKMHAAGAAPAAVSAAVEEYLSYSAEQTAQAEAASAQALAKADESLKREWGQDYEANKALAVRAFTALGGDNLAHVMNTAMFEGVPLGNHPAMIKAFAEIGRRTSEDGFQAGSLSADQVSNVNSQIDNLYQERHKAQRSGNNRLAQEIDQKISALYKQLHPN